MNATLFALVLAAYLCGGVFIARWMDENYFDALSPKGKDADRHALWRTLFWPFILPFVWLKIRNTKQQKAEESRRRREEEESKRKQETIAIPDTATEIDEGACSGYGSLRSAVIPNTVEAIGRFAFSGCGALQQVVIPASVRHIDPEAFSHCANLRLEVAADNPMYEMQGGHLVTKKDKVLVMGRPKQPIPSTVRAIGERAFNWCADAVEEIVLPDTVTSIGKEAFRACANMTRIFLPESLTEIGHGAFDECDRLAEIRLPGALRKLGDIFGDQAIEVYSALTDPTRCKVDYDEDDPESWVHNMDNRLHVPKGCRAIYQKTAPWRHFETIEETEQ